MLQLRLPEYVQHIFSKNEITNVVVHQFLFVFQGEYYSHSFFVSEKIGPFGMQELVYSFCNTDILYPDQINTTEETIGAALWYRYNKKYNLQDNIDMIMEDDENIQKISLDKILKEGILKIKRKAGGTK